MEALVITFDLSRWTPFGGYEPFVPGRRRPSARVSRCIWAPFGGRLPSRRSRVRQPTKAPDEAPASDLHTGVAGHGLTPQALLDSLAAGRRAASTVTRKEQAALVSWCFQKARTTEIESLIERGHVRNARRARSKYCERREVAFAALYRSSYKEIRVVVGMSREEIEEVQHRRFCLCIGHLADVGRFGRPARSRYVIRQKTGGGTRVIHNFRMVDRARQIVLKSAITPFANLHEGQFMLARDPGCRGPAAVRNSLLAALNRGGDKLFVQFDVSAFYASVSHAWLEAKLGISPETIRKHVHTGGMIMAPMGKRAVVRGCHEAVKPEKDRRGLPEGSILSPIIAEWVMADVIRSAAVFEELEPFIWSDNIGVLVPRSRVEEVKRLVCAAFAAHGAGPFHLNVCTENSLDQGFKFLGVWYRRGANGYAEPYIPAWAANGFDQKTRSDILTASPKELEKIKRRARGKLAQWSWWSGAAELERGLMNLIDSALEGYATNFGREISDKTLSGG